jgi:hypothetical protein
MLELGVLCVLILVMVFSIFLLRRGSGGDSSSDHEADHAVGSVRLRALEPH